MKDPAVVLSTLLVFVVVVAIATYSGSVYVIEWCILTGCVLFAYRRRDRIKAHFERYSDYWKIVIGTLVGIGVIGLIGSDTSGGFAVLGLGVLVMGLLWLALPVLLIIIIIQLSRKH